MNKTIAKISKNTLFTFLGIFILVLLMKRFSHR